MGISVALENEKGAAIVPLVLDLTNAFGRSLPHYDDTSFPCLRFVDPYGDTTFNNLQIPFLIEDLKRLRKGANDDLASFLEEVIGLAQKAGTHQYVKFYGD